TPTDIRNNGMALLQALEFASQKIADPRRICDIFLLKQPHGFERRRETNRVPAESGGVSSWFPSHEIGMCHPHHQRHARSNALRNADDVGMKIRMLEGEHLPGTPHAALHFVCD